MAVGEALRRPLPTGISQLLPRAGSVNGVKSASFVVLMTALAGRSSLLPQSKETSGPAGGGWQSYQDAERTGNAALDMAKVYRETHTSGWRFCGLILVKDGVVIYKLTSGQPGIHEIAEDRRNSTASAQQLLPKGAGHRFGRPAEVGGHSRPREMSLPVT